MTLREGCGALFVEAESFWAYFRLFAEIFNKHGLPQSVYADRHSIFWTDREPTIEGQLKNQRPTTEVGRGLEELGVTLIPAGPPQGSQVLRADEHVLKRLAQLTIKQEITTSFSFS